MEQVEQGSLQPKELSAEERTRQIIEKNEQELARRKEVGELAPDDFELNYLIYLQEMDQPLTRKDIGNHALVITQKELERLGYLEILLADSDEPTVIDPEDTGYGPDDPIIIFPEELGDIKQE